METRKIKGAKQPQGAPALDRRDELPTSGAMNPDQEDASPWASMPPHRRPACGWRAATRIRRGILLGAATSLPVIALVLALASLVFAQAPTEGVPAEKKTAASENVAPDVKRLLKQFDEMYESSGTTSNMEITITRPRKTRTRASRRSTNGAFRQKLRPRDLLIPA